MGIVLFPSIALPVDAGIGATFTNLGPSTVYYGTHQSVSSTLSDGSIALGATATLTGTIYLVVAPTAERAYVNVNDTDTGFDIAVQDEGVDLAVRQKINFTGTNVVATDDAVNNRISVAISGTPGPTGAAGPAGAGALGTDVWASQASPGAVTDWGPIINALAVNHTRLLFSGHDFPFTTPINVDSKTGVFFEGLQGLVWEIDQAAAARLIFTGTGSGVAFTLRGSTGVRFSDLGLHYSSASYTGDLIRVGGLAPNPSSFAQFERCNIGSVGGVTRTARCLFNLVDAVNPIIRQCALAGAASGIRGSEVGSSITGNDAVIAECMFVNFSYSCLTNIGENWRLTNLTFEFPAVVTGGTPSAIDSDVTCVSSFWATGMTFWDQAVGTEIPVRQRAGNTWSLASFTDCFFDIFWSKHFELLGPGGTIVLRNVHTSSGVVACPVFMDLGTSAAGALKSAITIEDCGIPGGAIANLNGGHGNINIRGSGDGLAGAEFSSSRGHERSVALASNPGGGAQAGQTHVYGTGITGTDRGGMLQFSTDGGGPSNVGVVMNFTFVQTGIPPTAGRPPVVLITPIAIGGDNPATAALCGAYATNCSSTGFSLATSTAIPAGSKVAFAYRVLWT